MTTVATIGQPFRCEELEAAEVLRSLGSYTACVNDPPWSAVAATLPPPARLVVSEPPADHADDAARAWEFVCRLPRAGGD